MRLLSKYFFRGLFTLLPFALTLYVFFLLISESERFARNILTPILGDFNIPFLGLILSVSIICLLGYIVSQRAFNRFLSFVEMPFKNVPLVKSVYSALKSFSDYFSPSGETVANQVVVVKIPGQPLELMGFRTRRSLRDMPDGFTKEGKVAVFFPMSYQIGGFTAFIPKDWVSPVDMPVEIAMRSALTAWMPGKEALPEDE
jgi:uncharacterized membrane protein